MELGGEKALWLLSPRITVLVTAISKKGQVNAAPYSFVGPLSIVPPMCYVSSGKGKDTEAFTRETKEFVLNLVSVDFAQAAIACEARLPRGESELEKFGLHEKKSKFVKAPSVKEAHATVECKLTEVIKPKGSDHVLLIGKILGGTCEFERDGGKPDLDRLELVMHVAGAHFRKAGERITLERNK
ncbi:MAG: flavin reductase family protein [Candidatus Diapherotrites archaeon]|nr:flavin reductase family protein [Candidatus Diapherotrites archaeon]